MFAHFLERAEDVLDGYGGTEVLQLSQGRLRLERGSDRLACLRLTPRGLLRWYAGCCDTPIGNVPAQRRLPSQWPRYEGARRNQSGYCISWSGPPEAGLVYGLLLPGAGTARVDVRPLRPAVMPPMARE